MAVGGKLTMPFADKGESGTRTSSWSHCPPDLVHLDTIKVVAIDGFSWLPAMVGHQVAEGTPIRPFKNTLFVECCRSILIV